MPDANDPPRPQPVTLSYSTPARPIKPTRASYIALIMGLVAAGFFGFLVVAIWGRVRVGSPGLLLNLWVFCAAVGFVAGVRGARDCDNYGGAGRGMSWVGIGVGGVTVLLLMIPPVGTVNVSLLVAIMVLAVVALKK